MPVHTYAVAWSEQGNLRLLDQTRLPGETRYLEIDSVEALAEAIGSLRVRGAPLIGIAAAMGLAAAAKGVLQRGGSLDREWLAAAVAKLQSTRPTAVNLGWALSRMRAAFERAWGEGKRGAEMVDALREEGQRIWDEDAAMCEAIGRAGEGLVPPGATVLTHCNTGFLATGGIGTAFGVIYTAHRAGKGIDVVVTETRPLGQGARLTAFELVRAGIPGRVIVDSAAAALMAAGEIDLVIVGADRVAANGDVANKIGTYALAVLARVHDIPFYVAAPRSSIDLQARSGDDIPIERRPAGEIANAAGVEVYNPAFDVTPAELVTALVTDRGVAERPNADSIRALLEE
ncbi:MAG: methylthioribose-1-phosphate isomerase [Gemmatimonadales bacterium]|nr:MAG: methylthioribose-1-phosphate isomerase [Gemmatimonadales bacterium]